MTVMNNDKDITNKIAAVCKETGHASEELFRATEALLRRRLHQFNIDFETEMGFAYLCLATALRRWNPEKGDFPLTLYYTLGSESQQYWTRNTGPVTVSQYSKKEHKDAGINTTIVRESENWDSLFGETNMDDVDFYRELDVFKDSLDPRERLFFDMFYLQGISREEIASTTPLGTGQQQYIGKKVKTKYRKFLEKRVDV